MTSARLHDPWMSLVTIPQALDMPGGEKCLNAEDYVFVHPDRSFLTINLWVCHTVLPFLYLGILGRKGDEIQPVCWGQAAFTSFALFCLLCVHDSPWFAFLWLNHEQDTLKSSERAFLKHPTFFCTVAKLKLLEQSVSIPEQSITYHNVTRSTQ